MLAKNPSSSYTAAAAVYMDKCPWLAGHALVPPWCMQTCAALDIRFLSRSRLLITTQACGRARAQLDLHKHAFPIPRTGRMKRCVLPPCSGHYCNILDERNNYSLTPARAGAYTHIIHTVFSRVCGRTWSSRNTFPIEWDYTSDIPCQRASSITLSSRGQYMRSSLCAWAIILELWSKLELNYLATRAAPKFLSIFFINRPGRVVGRRSCFQIKWGIEWGFACRNGWMLVDRGRAFMKNTTFCRDY